MDKVKIDFGTRAPTYGLATVAFTRTRRLEDMLIEDSFDASKVFHLAKDGDNKRKWQAETMRLIQNNINSRHNRHQHDGNKSKATKRKPNKMN